MGGREVSRPYHVSVPHSQFIHSNNHSFHIFDIYRAAPELASSGAAFSIITQLSYITIFEALAPFFTM